MKKMIALAALALAAVSANAGVNVTVRGDYLNTPKFDGRAGSEITGTSIFKASYARMGFDGKVGDASVKGRLDLGASSITSSESMVEYLYISKEFATGLTVNLGKLENTAGGIESGLVTSGDNYLTTLANGGNGGLGSTYLSAVSDAANANTTPRDAGNSRGVGLVYKMGDHALEFQVTNSSNHLSSTSTALSTMKRHNMGLSYSGSFADKMVMPVIGYHVGAADEYNATTGGTTGYEEKFLNVGAKFNFSGVGLTAEYLKNSKKASTDGAKENNVASMYVLVDYTMDSLKPFLKYESSEYKDQDTGDSANSFKRTGLNVGLEITPKAGDAFRYHVAYLSTQDKYGVTTAPQKETVNWSQIVAGIKYSADLLK